MRKLLAAAIVVQQVRDACKTTGFFSLVGHGVSKALRDSILQAAEYLGVTDRTIRQMIADGRLTGYRSGRRLVRLRVDEVDAAMKPFGGAA